MTLVPFSHCSPPEPPDSPCSFLFEAAEEMLATAVTGLAPWLPPTSGPCADTFDTYVSMGPPVAERYDAMSIYLQSLGPTPQAVNQAARLGDCNGIYPQLQASWDIQLWVNCYPTARREGDTLIVPPPEKLNAVNEHVYAWGMGIYNALQLAVANSSWELPSQIARVTIGNLTPLGPQGQAVGWKVPLITVIG